MAMRVAIATGLIEQCCALADASRHEEVCGLLLGDGERIDAILPAANVAEDPRTAFEVDPAVLLAAHRAARLGGPQIVGCYHSHPNGSATPSPADAAAAVPGQYWLILAGGQARLYRAGKDGRFMDCVMTSA
jgi:proteasome lid subunit RPN8/RPN11